MWGEGHVRRVYVYVDSCLGSRVTVGAPAGSWNDSATRREGTDGRGPWGDLRATVERVGRWRAKPDNPTQKIVLILAL